MTLKRWIESRTPVPPPALLRRMHPTIEMIEASGARSTDDAALDAALDLARQILSDGAAARDAAITLLAADALVTYAFEAAAERPDTLDALAIQAITGISAIAERRA